MRLYPTASAAYTLNLQKLGGVVLLLGAGAAGSLHAAPANGTAPAAAPEKNITSRQTRDKPPQAHTGNPVHITRQPIESLDPLLKDAYLAYRNGKLDEAQRLYLGVFNKDAHNADALLGLAAIALRHGDNLNAARYYSRVLALDPRNPWANAGMAALSVDDGSNESRLKLLLDEQGNAAALHFALGNLYAGQSRWGEARQAYFNACTLEPDNAGFVFNLAVSLDHLGQRDLAARHYQNALQLDPAASAGFDHAQIGQRIEELSR